MALPLLSLLLVAVRAEVWEEAHEMGIRMDRLLPLLLLVV